jgi:uncharacterized membrane protein
MSNGPATMTCSGCRPAPGIARSAGSMNAAIHLVKDRTMQRLTTDESLDLAKWMSGAAAGALLIYMLDPDRGGARRARSVAALRGAGARLGAAAAGMGGQAGNKIGGRAGSEHGDKLRDEVRDAAGAASNAAALDGAAGKPLARVGHVIDKTLGQMLDDTLSNARRVLGVEAPAGDAVGRVKNTAQRAGDGAALPWADDAGGMGRFAANVRKAFSPSAGGDGAWPPTLRNTALIGGGLLALNAVLRRSPLSLALGLAGAALLARGGPNRPLRRLANGYGLRLDQPVDVERSIHIDAAPAEVYDLFADYENYPRFMSHVVDVRDLGRRRSHWTVKGPAGSEFEWNSVVTEQNRPYRLAWRSEAGAEIPHNGSVRLEARRGGTDVTVRMSYTPPAGALGHGLATLLGADPASRLEEDLAHMKAYVEHGATPRDIATRRGHRPRAGARLLH